jgi:Fe-S-cluster containining protein
MESKIDKADKAFFLAALKEEARSALWDVGSSADPDALIDGILDELQALAPREGAEEDRSEEEIMTQVRQRLLKAAYATRPHCIRCGKCCETGSPTLVEDDLELFQEDILTPAQCYTIREGETVYSGSSGEALPADREMIKVRESPDSRTCVFYRNYDKSCSIYESRPRQCRKQECWNPEEAKQVFDMPRLSRRALLESTGPLWEIIERHEERCSHIEVNRAMARLNATKGRTVDEVLEILRFDEHVRTFIAENFQLSEDTIEFFLGRSLLDVVAMYGLKVVDQPDGSVLLTAAEAAE